jgi:glycosyltransferase involved in cell wall biosynthesis
VRVAFCIDNMNVGGTELNALRTARHLLERGVGLSVFSLSSEGPLLQRYAELEVPVHVLPIESLYGRTAWRYGRELARTLRHERTQVLHAHDLYSNVFAAPWSRLAGAAFIASRRWWKGPARRVQRWANRCSYALADRVLANSPAVGELLTTTERVRPSKVIVVPNFLEEEAFETPPPGWREGLARELALPEERLVIGIVASLSPIKDHATLLQAVATMVADWPQLHVVLVGDDRGRRSQLEALTAELELQERVHFAGQRPAAPSLHHLFDVSVLTSTSEGMPNSIIEAMAAGRPVVATSVGAVKDAIADGITGVLVPPRDVQALRSQLNLLLGDPRRRNLLGAAGRKKARAQYSVAAAIEPLLGTYLSLAGRTR